MSNFIKSLKDDLARAKIIIKNDYETKVEQEFKNSDYFEDNPEFYDDAFIKFKENILSFDDFVKAQHEDLKDLVNMSVQTILRAIDTETIEDLKILKKIKNQIEKISDDFYYSSIAIDKAQ